MMIAANSLGWNNQTIANDSRFQIRGNSVEKLSSDDVSLLWKFKNIRCMIGQGLNLYPAKTAKASRVMQAKKLGSKNLCDVFTGGVIWLIYLI